MARPVNRLSARTAATLKEPGRHADGNGLYLQVDPADEGQPAKRWVFVFQWRGKRKEMGLGPLSLFGVADAREMALQARKAVARGVNPIEERKALKARSEGRTFGEVADEVLALRLKGLSSDTQAAAWTRSLKVLAAPIREIPISEITTDDVVKMLKPLWEVTPETASRLRGRVEKVLDAAKAKGLRGGENPARWRGHLDHLLSERKALTRGHHAALPYADAPTFWAELKTRQAVAGAALQFTILNVSRTGEVIGAKDTEVDGDLWVVPAWRMKARKEHAVPLTPAALAVLESVKPLRSKAGWLFPGAKDGPLSNMAMDMLLRRMGYAVTVHGFRSTFRDWAGDCTDFPREVIEAALAHAVGGAVERAYRRGTAFDKRRKLLEAWADYLGGPGAVQQGGKVGGEDEGPA